MGIYGSGDSYLFIENFYAQLVFQDASAVVISLIDMTWGKFYS